MMQPVPNAPIPADDFLISDDTDLDAASQWLLGMQVGAAAEQASNNNTEPQDDPMAMFESHPDILPDPMPLHRPHLQNVAKLSATVHPAILPDIILDGAEDRVDDIAPMSPPLNGAKRYISEPDILEDVSSGYVLPDDDIIFTPTARHQDAKLNPAVILEESDDSLFLAEDDYAEPPKPQQPAVKQQAYQAPRTYQPWNNVSSEDLDAEPAPSNQFQKPRQWVDIQNPQSLWLEVLERLKSQMTKPSFETWIAPLRLLSVSDDRVILSVDSEFNRDWVLKKYRALLTEAFSSRLERMVMIQLDVDDTMVQAEPQIAVFDELPDHLQKPKPGKKQAVWTPRTAQSNLNPKYTFDNFIVGTGNRFCHAAALAVAETPAQSYNPFFIYGGVGLGKTHIMQAIAHFAHQHHPEMAVRYVTAEQFTNELINAITGKTMKAFRDRYRKNDILIIDDIQFLEGKERTQEEIFHTFNALHQSGKQIILSSDRAPRYLSQLEDRLRSRFEWGLITDIQPADFETRLAILKSKVKRDHFHVPDDVLVFIAESYPNNIRELEGALNKVTAYAMLTKTILDLATAKHLLGANQQEPTQISKEKIIEVVAEYYHLSAADLKSPSRAKDVSHARQVAIYVLRHLTEASFPKIGDLLGGRKHTTILYAYEKMKEELERHPNLAQQVQEITGRVKAPS